MELSVPQNQFSVCKGKLTSLNVIIFDKTMSLKQVSTAASKSDGQGFHKIQL